MKSWKNVTLENICEIENIKYAKQQASRGKRNRQSVIALTDDKLIVLSKQMQDGTYRPQPTKRFDKIDKYTGKIRTIDCPAFVDQVVDHALVQYLEPHMTKFFHYGACASIVGKGINYARKLIRRCAIKDRKGAHYVIKADIRKFYSNVDLSILMAKLAKYIRDKRVLDLIRTRISQTDKGLLLGSYLSQWLANFYLTSLDRAIAQLEPKTYVRYMDNITIIFKSKRKVKLAIQALKRECADLNVEIKEHTKEGLEHYKWNDKGITCAGYRTDCNGRQKVSSKVYKATVRLINSITRHCKASIKSIKSLASRIGFAKYATNCGLYLKGLKVIALYHKCLTL